MAKPCHSKRNGQKTVVPATNVIPSIDTSLDSEDSAYTYCPGTDFHKMSNVSSQNASTTQSSPSSPPTLSSGIVSPKVFQEWETMCLRYFSIKTVTAGERIARMIHGLESPGMQDWICIHSICLSALTFDDFIGEFKKKWLHKNWKDDICNKVIGMQGDHTFWEWQNDLRNNNNILLTGLLDHITLDNLHKHFSDCFNNDL